MVLQNFRSKYDLEGKFEIFKMEVQMRRIAA